MKQIAMVLILGVLSGGCLPFVREQPKPPPVDLQPSAPPAVSADEVNEANAAEKAKALREELEHARKCKAVPVADRID